MRAVLTILAIWLAGLGAAAQFGKISILYQDLERHYAGAGPVGIGLMVSVVGMVGLVFGTSAGVAVARIGARRAILAALVLGAAVSAVQALLPPYPVMMLSRVLEGAAHLTIVVVGPTSIAAVAAGRWQGAAMTLWSSFFGLTYAVLAFAAPGFVAVHGDSALFWAHSAWMLGCFGLLWILMPQDPPRDLTQGSQRGAGPASGDLCLTLDCSTGDGVRLLHDHLCRRPDAAAA